MFAKHKMNAAGNNQVQNCYFHHKGQAQGHKVIYLGVIMKGYTCMKSLYDQVFCQRQIVTAAKTRCPKFHSRGINSINPFKSNARLLIH